MKEVFEVGDLVKVKIKELDYYSYRFNCYTLPGKVMYKKCLFPATERSKAVYQYDIKAFTILDRYINVISEWKNVEAINLSELEDEEVIRIIEHSESKISSEKKLIDQVNRTLDEAKRILKKYR